MTRSKLPEEFFQPQNTTQRFCVVCEVFKPESGYGFIENEVCGLDLLDWFTMTEDM